MPLFSWAVLRSVSHCLCSPIFLQSAINRMTKNISCPNIAVSGEALSTVRWVDQTAHALSGKKTSMSLAFTELAILISAVRNIFVKTAWIPSCIAFTCGFLKLVSLCFLSYVLPRARKWGLNLLPLLYIKYQQRGYLLNQVLYTRLLIYADDLSNVVSD